MKACCVTNMRYHASHRVGSWLYSLVKHVWGVKLVCFCSSQQCSSTWFILTNKSSTGNTAAIPLATSRAPLSTNSKQTKVAAAKVVLREQAEPVCLSACLSACNRHRG